jgi:AraC-type DNA-binding domain-containing proteins
MGRNKRERLEFRYYEIPQKESVLALLGDSWRGPYGRDDKYLHFHNLLEIGVCHQGRGILTLGDRECPYSDGMISVIPANCPHTTLSENEDFWEFLFLDPAQLLKEMYPNDAGLREKQLAVINRRALLLEPAEGAALSSLALGIIAEMQRREPYYREAVRHLVKVFLFCLMRLNEELGGATAQETLSRPQIQPALAYMEANFRNDIRAEDLAKQCGLSEPHFRRVFREYVSMPPIDYLNSVRIREACRIMDQRDCSMDLVASECGFSSVSAFTRNFKKLLGTTPYQWKLEQERRGAHLRDYNITVLKGWESL